MTQAAARAVPRTLLVGAGGLGGPIARALAAAGHELSIVDHDVVELSNLHRQIHFAAADVGAAKATRLAARVGGTGIVAKWAPGLGESCDLIVDATDDPETKFAIADWAVANGRRYAIASAVRFGGNVFAGAPGAACYRCLFEEPSDAPTCADAGVLGPVVGAIGGVAAAVAIGLAAGDRALAGALLVFDDLRRVAEPRIVRFAPRSGCVACARAPITPQPKEVSDAEHPRTQRSS
jgi:molybdopterin/thiamine biosynthesis adenylyltransferase